MKISILQIQLFYHYDKLYSAEIQHIKIAQFGCTMLWIVNFLCLVLWNAKIQKSPVFRDFIFRGQLCIFAQNKANWSLKLKYRITPIPSPRSGLPSILFLSEISPSFWFSPMAELRMIFSGILLLIFPENPLWYLIIPRWSRQGCFSGNLQEL